MSMANKRVGLIGVGLLGTALAERMHQAGFVVSGYDTNWVYYDRQLLERPELAATVVKTASAEQLASQHDTIVMCLPDSTAVELALGLFEHLLHPGSLII